MYPTAVIMVQCVHLYIPMMMMMMAMIKNHLHSLWIYWIFSNFSSINFAQLYIPDNLLLEFYKTTLSAYRFRIRQMFNLDNLGLRLPSAYLMIIMLYIFVVYFQIPFVLVFFTFFFHSFFILSVSFSFPEIFAFRLLFFYTYGNI